MRSSCRTSLGLRLKTGTVALIEGFVPPLEAGAPYNEHHQLGDGEWPKSRTRRQRESGCPKKGDLEEWPELLEARSERYRGSGGRRAPRGWPGDVIG